MKKVSKKMDEMEKDASLSALDKIKSEALAGMAKKIGGMKKVEVASDSKEGLKEGLMKAKEMIDKSPAMVEKESSEEESDEIEDSEELSLEEVNSKIEELMELKKKLESEQN